MTQEQGVVGAMVGAMIRRSVRQRFRNVFWRNSLGPISPPSVLYANHHGWMDGYLMFQLAKRLHLVSVDWIEEFDTFPLFRFVGGMRYPKGDLEARVATIRKTISEMHAGRSLVIFPEGVLHRPPCLAPFGKAMTTIAKHVPNAVFVPVAIYQEMSMHERPEAWLSVGKTHAFESLEDCETRLQGELDSLRSDVHLGKPFEVLAQGTPSINERMSLRRFKNR